VRKGKNVAGDMGLIIGKMARLAAYRKELRDAVISELPRRQFDSPAAEREI